MAFWRRDFIGVGGDNPDRHSRRLAGFGGRSNNVFRIGDFYLAVQGRKREKNQKTRNIQEDKSFQKGESAKGGDAKNLSEKNLEKSGEYDFSCNYYPSYNCRDNIFVEKN